MVKRRKTERYLERLSLIVLLMIFAVVVIRPLFIESPGIPEDEDDPFPPARRTEPFPLQVYNHREGKVMEMDLEEYLVGVVAGEMPASFHPEALRAQAVAARTYTLQKVLDGGGCSKHSSAQICTDHTCCQAWTCPETLSNRPQGASSLERFRGAVLSTAGLALRHEGRFIDAVYHSTCGGHTAAAHHVWSGSAPYLEAVSCGFCDHSPWHATRKEVPIARFRQVFSRQGTLPVLTNAGLPRLEILEVSAHGRAKTFQVGSESFSAWQFRQLMDLPTAWLTYTCQGDAIHFDLQGFGHGVGMCQYGADGMGKAGWTFEEILLHYYRGVTLE